MVLGWALSNSLIVVVSVSCTLETVLLLLLLQLRIAKSIFVSRITIVCSRRSHVHCLLASSYAKLLSLVHHHLLLMLLKLISHW